MAVIKSGATTDELTLDPTSKASRVTNYDTNGIVSYFNRAKLFRGAISTFRTLGTAAVPHPVFTIENTSGSGRTVAIRRLIVNMDATAALTSVACLFDVSRPTNPIPSGGTALAKIAYDTALASHANVVCRGATASDGGGATAITATAGPFLWRQFLMRQPTAVGQIIPGTAASNAATNHYIVSCQWDEY